MELSSSRRCRDTILHHLLLKSAMYKPSESTPASCDVANHSDVISRFAHVRQIIFDCYRDASWNLPNQRFSRLAKMERKL